MINESAELIGKFKNIMDEQGRFVNVKELSDFIMCKVTEDWERFLLLQFVMDNAYVQGEGSLEFIIYNQPSTYNGIIWLEANINRFVIPSK